MIKFMSQFVIRHVISVVTAVGCAILLTPHLGFGNGPWLMVSSFLVCQTTRGTPLKQGIMIAVLLVMSVWVGAGAMFLMPNVRQAGEIAALVATILIFFARDNQALLARYLSVVIVTLLLLIVMPSPSDWVSVKFHLVDSLMGSFIGLVCATVILPVDVGHEFVSGVVPILDCLGRYSERLGVYFSKEETTKALSMQMNHIRHILQSAGSIYPNWVYEVGFNRGLRAGFRYFLIEIESVTELLFSMDYLLVKGIKAKIPEELYPLMASVCRNNALLIDAIRQRMVEAREVDLTVDLTSDMACLQQTVKKYVPGNLARLMISEPELNLMLFVRHLMDIRARLLQIASAVP